MIGINTRNWDSVTFTITLPAGGMMTDQIAALKNARDKQAKLRNLDGAQSLHMIIVMAEAGLHAFNTSTVVPQIMIPSGSVDLPPRS